MTNRISKSKSGIIIQLDVLISRDKETKLYVSYCPSLELSSYGKTKEEAKKAFHEVLEDFVEDTYEKGTFNEYLFKHGWQLKTKPEMNYLPPVPDITDLVNNIMPTEAFKQSFKIPAYR